MSVIKVGEAYSVHIKMGNGKPNMRYGGYGIATKIEKDGVFFNNSDKKVLFTERIFIKENKIS